MPSHAIVTNIGNERADELGVLRVDVYSIIHNPEMQGTGAGLDARVIVSSGVEITDTSPATWTTSIKTAVVATGVALGFTDLVDTSVLMPTIA